MPTRPSRRQKIPDSAALHLGYVHTQKKWDAQRRTELTFVPSLLAGLNAFAGIPLAAPGLPLPLRNVFALGYNAVLTLLLPPRALGVPGHFPTNHGPGPAALLVDVSTADTACLQTSLELGLDPPMQFFLA